MKLSRNSILLLCTAVATMTSIGMSTFSLFLPPIEKEFGLTRSMVTLPYYGCNARLGRGSADFW